MPTASTSCRSSSARATATASRCSRPRASTPASTCCASARRWRRAASRSAPAARATRRPRRSSRRKRRWRGRRRMSEPKTKPITIDVDARARVSALLLAPPRATACFVFAHGAGAGMAHPFMSAIAEGLAARGIASLRYQFPYMERRSKRVDPPKIAHAAVRAAVTQARRQLPDLPLVAGGKSFGARMTSQAQGAAALDGVVRLAFLGFPLHPPGRPSRERGEHLADVKIPMLFLQGTRDEFAALNELEPVVKALGARATLTLFADADHSFHVPARTGRKDADVRAEVLDAMADWIARVIANRQ